MDVKEELDAIRKHCDEIEREYQGSLADFLAIRVMGWHKAPAINGRADWLAYWHDERGTLRCETWLWHPDKDIHQARKVLDAMWEKGYEYRIDAEHTDGGKFAVRFYKAGHQYLRAFCPSESLAICEAAKQAVVPCS